MGDERIVPLFRKKKTLWQITELEGYFNKIESHIPPDYDAATCGSVHQSIDAIIKPNWESLHSLEQDFIHSWFNEFKIVLEQKKKSQIELDAVNKEMATTLQASESKIDGLNKEIQDLTTEISNLKNALAQKMQFLDDLTNAVQNQKLSSEELKQKLEQRVNNMRTQMIQQQKEFEANQIDLGKQFEAKVLELDEHKLLLNETFEKNKKIVNQLEKENHDLKQKRRSIKTFQEKINQLKTVIAEISPNLLLGGGS